ncbi:unannotated protein [freshwater metagenome]|uniref:Unannotated protein n=1 Tax=freshwater metagenome TaxID=449393 RepID=A0A6J6HKB3_9ZZZZ
MGVADLGQGCGDLVAGQADPESLRSVTGPDQRARTESVGRAANLEHSAGGGDPVVGRIDDDPGDLFLAEQLQSESIREHVDNGRWILLTGQVESSDFGHVAPRLRRSGRNRG